MKRLSRTVPDIFLAIWAGMILLPMIWIVIGGFKSDREILTDPWGLPSELLTGNFWRAWEVANIGTYALNSILVVFPSVAFTLAISAPVSYIFARYQFKLRRALQLYVLSGLMFPVFLALVPLFFLTNSLGLLNTKLGLILVYGAYSLSFTTLFLTNFFRTIPSELAEAATIDGASEFQVFWKIMLPLAAPGIFSMAIFNFIGQWNQFVLPFVLMTDSKNYVLPQGLQVLMVQQEYASDWSALFAALNIVMIPTIIVYTIFQRQIQAGLTSGALK